MGYGALWSRAGGDFRCAQSPGVHEMASAFEHDVIDELLDDEFFALAEQEEIDELLTEYLDRFDEGESSGPCYDAFLWCMQNSRRRNIPFGQSVCHACWDQCREGTWPARIAGRMCPSPSRFRRRRRRLS